MPLLGGLAVAAGATAGTGHLHPALSRFVTGLDGVWGILIGGSLMLAIGAVDDRFGLGALAEAQRPDPRGGSRLRGRLRDPDVPGAAFSGVEFELPFWLVC